MKKVRTSYVAVSVFGMLLYGSRAGAQTEYRFIHVDDFLTNYGLGECYVYDISDQNVACGTATAEFQMPNGSTMITYTGFTWTQSPGKAMAQVSWPHGINNAGLMAGVSGVFDSTTGQFTSVPLLPNTYSPLVLNAVNDLGVAVGSVQICNCSNSQGTLQIPYIWDAVNGARSLPVPGANGASKITNSGLVIGWLGGNSRTDGFLFDLTAGTYILASSLFTGTNTQTTFTDISETGVVTGWRLSPNGAQSTGFTWSPATGLRLLPMPPAGYQPHVRPSGINNDGTVVGSIYTTTATQVPFVYDSPHGLRVLSTLVTPVAGYAMMTPTAINNNGWITGFGSGGGFGIYTSFVLKPNKPGDLNDDGFINLQDLAMLLGSYGLCTGQSGFVPQADLNGNGCVDLGDLSNLLANYGT